MLAGFSGVYTGISRPYHHQYLSGLPALRHYPGATVGENIAPAVQHIRDMVADFETISLKMGEPDADIDALSSKMDRLQVWKGCGEGAWGVGGRWRV